MIPYADLRQILCSLEEKVGTSTPHAVPIPLHVRTSLSPVQGYALSNDTAGKVLPVVVAIGANYTQSEEKTPRDIWRSPTAVEDDLKKCRARVDEALRELNQRWVELAKASHEAFALGEGYHLVMTNFCLWNTDVRWQNIDPKCRATLLANNPSFNGGATSAPGWAHLARLSSALSSNPPLWIAHGIHSEVFNLFQPLAASLGMKRWMMTPNLSYRYFHYGKCYPRP